MVINQDNITAELKRWFTKSVLADDVDYTNLEVYKNALSVFIYDYQRYFDEKEIRLSNILNRIELQGILLYRIAREYFLTGNHNSADKISLLGRFLSGFEIYYSADIGKGLKINHGLGLVIGARTKIGENVLLHQGVTFGDKNGGRPVIGNNVTVYAGAKILGNVFIDDNVTIAANCVCFIDVSKNKTVVGIPARILNK